MEKLEAGVARLNEIIQWVDKQKFTSPIVIEYWRGFIHGMEGLLEHLYSVDLIWNPLEGAYDVVRTDETER